MFEPVHGSAPDIAGKGICDRMARIPSATRNWNQAACTQTWRSEKKKRIAVERTLFDEGWHVQLWYLWIFCRTNW